MNTLKAGLLVFFSILSIFANCQTNTSIGLEASVTRDLFSYISEEEILKSPSQPSGYIGFNISEAITQNLSLETGIILKKYVSGYILDIETTNGRYKNSSGGFLSLQIPFRLHMEHPIGESKLSLFTTLGYHYCISLEYDMHGGSSSTSVLPSSGTLITNSKRNSGYEKTFSLLEAGLGVFYEFTNDAQVFISGSFFNGFKGVMKVDIEYQINDLPVKTASGNSSGNYWGIRIGYKHPFKLGGPVKQSLN